MTQSLPASLANLKRALGQVYLGDPRLIDDLLVALLCSGHVLLEDVPGLGKTTLAKALAKSVSLSFKRVQCTPDLMPADVTGGHIYQPQQQDFKFIPGPLFANLVLVDEINRASPRTQSAFLEAMAEGTVTIDRKTAQLPQPFWLIATQNPIEFAGTFALPEAQLDRFFMRLHLGYPSPAQSLALLKSHRLVEPVTQLQPQVTREQLLQWQTAMKRVLVNDETQEYIVALAHASREHRDLRLGASPRATIALMQAARAKAYLDGQHFATPAQVQSMVKAVWGHRLILRSSQDAARAAAVIDQLIANTPVPGVQPSSSQVEAQTPAPKRHATGTKPQSAALSAPAADAAQASAQ